jgi:hypothetical protein
VAPDPAEVMAGAPAGPRAKTEVRDKTEVKGLSKLIDQSFYLKEVYYAWI